MVLYIDTTQNNSVEVGLKKGDSLVASKKLKSDRTQAEKLLPAVEKMLKSAGVKLADLAGVKVANQGGSFTSLRIGVVTANALNYALGIKPLKIIKPNYGREPEITEKKSRNP